MMEPTASPTRYIRLDPNYESTVAYFASAFITHSWEKGAERESMVSLLEQAGYLARTDPQAFQRVIARIKAGGR